MRGETGSCVHSYLGILGWSEVDDLVKSVDHNEAVSWHFAQVITESLVQSKEVEGGHSITKPRWCTWESEKIIQTSQIYLESSLTTFLIKKTDVFWSSTGRNLFRLEKKVLFFESTSKFEGPLGH